MLDRKLSGAIVEVAVAVALWLGSAVIASSAPVECKKDVGPVLRFDTSGRMVAAPPVALPLGQRVVFTVDDDEATTPSF